MPTDARESRLMAVFLDELAERVVAFNRDLVSLETESSEDARAELIANLFRGAHSLKGAAGIVGAGDIGAVCHHLEDLLVTLLPIE